MPAKTIKEPSLGNSFQCWEPIQSCPGGWWEIDVRRALSEDSLRGSDVLRLLEGADKTSACGSYGWKDNFVVFSSDVYLKNQLGIAFCQQG